jgi:gamma-glutamyl-gamma-aminobutyraldehyde dehydrogenase
LLNQSDIDVLRHLPLTPRQHFINGAWASGSTGKTIDVISPIDGSFLTTLQNGSSDDVDAAVKSARQSFESGIWRSAPPAHRKKVLRRFAELIERDALELAVLGVRDNGTEIKMAINAEPMSAVGTFAWYSEAIDKVYGEVASTPDNVLGLIHREPVGVVGAIVPWNFPLMIGAWKLAPALATGNSVVLKPAEGASLSLLKLVELSAEAGLPDGVLNVVTGDGPVVGEALALHNDVDVLVFTGSGNVGRRLLEYSARSNLKRVYLELGGKSPNIVFSDAADLDVAAKVSAFGIFRNSGQVCVAGSRLLVQRSIHDEFLDKLVSVTGSLRVGDPLNLQSDIGAVSSELQLTQNLGFVNDAKDDGARVVTGGKRLFESGGGFYMQPAIVDNVNAESRLAQQEVFGPVLGVIPFDDEADAVRIANNTVYGLASAVWTSNLATAHRMIRGIRAGMVMVNCYGGADITMPLGGVRQSGNGHDKSLHALDKYTDLKAAWINLS